MSSGRRGAFGPVVAQVPDDRHIVEGPALAGASAGGPAARSTPPAGARGRRRPGSGGAESSHHVIELPFLLMLVPEPGRGLLDGQRRRGQVLAPGRTPGTGPIATQGAAEFPAALADLRSRLGLQSGPLALVGGSMGSAVAALTLTETAPAAGEAVTAAVLVSPMVQLRDAVDATGRRFGVTYPWGSASLEVAERLDFVARADEIARAGQPAVRLVVGSGDDAEGFLEPARRLHAALAARYADPSRTDLVVVSGMAHALADEPGVDPAPQTPAAAAVDRHATTWLRQHLACAAAEPAQ